MFEAALSRRLRAVLAGAVIAATPAVFAQGTIKIGVITDRVGPAKPYAEPVTLGVVFAA